MAETKRTFEQDDLFKRKPYAKILEKLILNSDSYHRDDDVQAYTIAIDSPWGTGKSVFLEKFENMLEADCPDQIRVVHYNAWQKDFWNNAFEPFANAIFSSEWFCNALERQTGAATAEKLLAAGRNFLVAYLKGHFEKEFDAEFADKGFSCLADAVGKAASKYPNAISKEYAEFTENLDLMQQAMAEVLNQTLEGGKLVIIIDELDRCRPTFAIETLEIVKHIMDVKDVVYIFALDVRQLGAAIKQVYGADTDATGYLMRFFSYYSRMPEADVEAMISQMNLANGVVPNAAKTLSIIAKEFGLNARDIETVGKVFTLMEDELLKDYQFSVAYKLYWILLCYKYKKPLDFDRKMKGEWSLDDKNRGAFLGSKSSLFEMEVPLTAITNALKMKDSSLKYLSGGSRNGQEIGRIFRVDLSENGEVAQVHGNFTAHCFTNKDSISGFLFLSDLKRWDEIKNLTPAQFLLQQMEMFNFIPEIPSATE